MLLINPYVFGGGAAVDPNFASVVLLMHLDGTNGSTTLIDNSSFGHTCISHTGTLTTAQQKFGTASWNSTGLASIEVADSSDWEFGSGQFTVEAFCRPTAALAATIGVLTHWGGSTNLGWFFGFGGSGTTLAFTYSTTGADFPSVSGSYTPTQNAWAHVAADRDASNVLRVYADGVVIASATVTATFFNSTRTLRVGNDEGGTRGLIGQIDEVRITKGVARYAGAFTPPAAAFPNS